MGNEDQGRWASGGGDLCVHGRRPPNSSLSTAHLGSRTGLRCRVFEEGHSGCVKEEDFADGDAGPLGRHSHPHGRGTCPWGGLPVKVRQN
jgi:hypothetical protein